MERSNNTSATPTVRRRRHRAGALRGGKITIVTLFVILGLIVLIGFVGNAGHVVVTKVNTQNAADAIAFSSAQWMARGMNAVTATNHLLGEVTGLVVVLEGLGGPEADEKMEDYPVESKTLDQIIRKLASTAPAKGGYGAGILGQVEKPVFDFIANKLVSPEGERAKSKAFATVYDSKMALKRDLVKRFLYLNVANVGFLFPPPFGFATAAGAFAAHAYHGNEIRIITQEWIILEGLDLIARNVKPIKVDILEKQLIPALAAHGDLLAGRVLPGLPLRMGVVNAGVEDTLEHLGEVYNVTAAIYPVSSAFKLPIEPEPEASVKIPTIKYKNEPEWGSDAPKVDPVDDVLGELEEDVERQKFAIRQRIIQIEQSIDGRWAPMDNNILTRREDEIEYLMFKSPDNPEVLAEREEIEKLVQKKQARIRELNAEMRKVDAELAKMKELVKEVGSISKLAGNLSIKDLPTDRLNQAEERYTQWARATYPFVDAFRAPILTQFKKHLEKCEAAEHYEKWTTRYALVKTWQFRSGYRFVGQKGTKNGQWKKEPTVKPLRMYVMVERFDPKKQPEAAKAGTKRIQKGYQEWTKDTTSGKEQAEEMFTVLGITHRPLEPLFSPVIYPVASDDGITTFAQAIYYNSNAQEPAPEKTKLKTQAKVGWDTLNWDPNSTTPEWGVKASVASDSDVKWPWDIFTSNPNRVGTARVSLNWQAKLMPVTKSRLTPAAAASAVVSRDMAKNLVFVLPLFDQMVTH